MRCAVSALLLSLGAEGRFLRAGNASNNSTDLTIASDRHYEGFKEDWHQEWRRGDFPAWKETQTTAWMDNSYNRYQPKDYVDSQSDGKPSPALLQGKSCVAQDLNRRAQLQNKLASVCEDMCKEVGAYPKCSQCPNFVPPDATPGVMTWEELLTHMDNLVDWGRDSLKGWKKQASALQVKQDEQACVSQDLKNRAQLQNKLASVCEDMCKEVGAYPKCSQCPNFVPPDATPGVMTWEELLTHMDNLVDWGRDSLKGWKKQASALQVKQDEQACVSTDLKRRAQLQNKLASVCEDMCKEVGAYPKCSQCPNFVPPDATPGVMTWEELLTHMDNLVDWGRDSLKGWKKQASALQLGRNATGNATDLTVASDRHYEGFKDEWHKEWRRGDFPSWKETQTTAWMDNSYNRYQPKDYVDSQSDGKPSPAMLQFSALVPTPELLIGA